MTSAFIKDFIKDLVKTVITNEVFFEFNNELTRNRFVTVMSQFLELTEIHFIPGLEFKILCEDWQNTPESIDLGMFTATVLYKVPGNENFVKLDVTVTKTGVSWEEIEGKLTVQ